MDDILIKKRMRMFEATCTGAAVVPEILFARSDTKLVLLSGPVLTLELLNEIREVVALKEASLRG